MKGRCEGYLGTRRWVGKGSERFFGTHRGAGRHCKRLSSYCFEVFLVRKTIGFVPFLEGVVPCGKQPRQRPRVLPYIPHELLDLWGGFFMVFSFSFIFSLSLPLPNAHQKAQGVHNKKDVY